MLRTLICCALAFPSAAFDPHVFDAAFETERGKDGGAWLATALQNVCDVLL